MGRCDITACVQVAIAVAFCVLLAVFVLPADARPDAVALSVAVSITPETLTAKITNSQNGSVLFGGNVTVGKLPAQVQRAFRLAGHAHFLADLIAVRLDEARKARRRLHPLPQRLGKQVRLPIEHVGAQIILFRHTSIIAARFLNPGNGLRQGTAGARVLPAPGYWRRQITGEETDFTDAMPNPPNFMPPTRDKSV